jgi:hypothetical protein
MPKVGQLMLNLLDEALEKFLRAAVRELEADVRISFEAPDRDWSARVAGPTVNLFLWDLRRNFDEQDAGMLLEDDGNGRRVRRPPLPRVDCRYLVTAWTSELRHEHSILGGVLQLCLQTSEIPEDYLPSAYAHVRPLPTLRLGMPDGKDTADFWSALGGQLKPGLDLVVTATVDAVPSWTTGPAVERYELTADLAADDARAAVNDSKGLSTEQRVWLRSDEGTVAPGCQR